MEDQEPTWQKGGLDTSEAPSCLGSEASTPSCTLGALYWACVRNDPAQLQAMLDDGVSPEEATMKVTQVTALTFFFCLNRGCLG